MPKGYVKEINGIKLFSDHGEKMELLDASKTVAEECALFQMDVEDEIIYENQITCYNCRYRRWHPNGFTCYKGFPNLN